MCGIFGALGDIDQKRAREAFATLSHRGPDEGEIYCQEGLFLGFWRLYILDEKAKQPFVRDDLVLAFNGEIYNYETLDPQGEAQAIARSYTLYKERFASKLQGMFAIAIFDGKKLLLARDMFGKKPLYFYKNGDLFLFASEIKAILAYLKEAKHSQEALSCYLSYGFIPSQATFYEDIYKLAPAQTLIWETREANLRIFSYDTILKPKEGDVESLLHTAVKKRLQGDFPIASLLSGGVDSSFVSALAKRMQGELATYSIGYQERSYSELDFAKEVAKHIGSEHHEVIFTKKHFFAALEELENIFDEPIGDSASVPLYFLLQRVKRDGFKVVLSGEGGDELFLGYRQYFEMLDLLKMKDLKYKNWLRNYFKAHFSPNKEWEWYKRIWSDEILFRSTSEVFTDLQKNLFLRQNVKDGESLGCISSFLQEWERSSIKREDIFMSFLDSKIRLGLYLHKLDSVSMAFGIEARTPLLDEEVARVALFHPKRTKEAKWLLKNVARKYIPSSIIERKKRGFSYPFMQWLKESAYLQELERINDQTGIFKKEQLRFLIENAKRNRFSRHFWLVFSYNMWLKKNFF